MTIAATAIHIHQGVPAWSGLMVLVLVRLAVVAWGAVAAPASMAQSSPIPLRFPPTKRMYENDTIITTINVSTAIAAPSP